MAKVDPKVARFARWMVGVGVFGAIAGGAAAPIWLAERDTGAFQTTMLLVACFFAGLLMHSWSLLYSWLVGRHSVAVRSNLQLWRCLPLALLAVGLPGVLMWLLQLRAAEQHGAGTVALAGVILVGLQVLAVRTTRQLVLRVEKALTL